MINGGEPHKDCSQDIVAEVMKNNRSCRNLDSRTGNHQIFQQQEKPLQKKNRKGASAKQSISNFGIIRIHATGLMRISMGSAFSFPYPIPIVYLCPPLHKIKPYIMYAVDIMYVLW